MNEQKLEFNVELRDFNVQVLFITKTIKLRTGFMPRTTCEIRTEAMGLLSSGTVQRHSADNNDPQLARILSLKKSFNNGLSVGFTKESRKKIYQTISPLIKFSK